MLLICLAPGAARASYGPTIEPLGPVEPVFIPDFNTNHGAGVSCDSAHIADLPAKAFRDNQNRIDMPTPNGEPPRVRATGSQPPITWQGSHRMLGPDLNNLKPEQLTTYPDRRLCTDPKSNVTYTNPFDPNFPCFPGPAPDCSGSQTPSNRAAQWPPPAGYEPWLPQNFHDYQWIDSPWAEGDGSLVLAFIHNNYRGFEDLNGDGVANDNCSVPDVVNYCWYASVTMVKSTDGGATFGCDTATAPQGYCGGPSGSFLAYGPPYYAGPPQNLVISSPYTFEPNTCCRQGVPEPSNVIKSGSFYYMMFRLNLPQDVTDAGPAQRQCVARTSNIDDPTSWRGWDGSGYNVRFVNPYTYPFSASDTRQMHLCAPVSTQIMPRTVVYSRYFNQFMLIGEIAQQSTCPNPNVKTQVVYSLSSDLISWTPPQLLLECEVYGSIIDANDPAASSTSSERNFYQPGQKAYLYAAGRIRTPIKFKAQRWATGLGDGCAGGFDGHTGTVATTAGRNYTGDDHAYFSTSAGAAPAFSYFQNEDYPTSCGNPSPDPVQVGDGSDVWYSGAFQLPSTDFDSQGKPINDVTFFRLENSTSAAGALSVRSDGRVHFVTDPNLSQAGDETELLQSGGQNGVPIANNGCWHFYEIHQKIGAGSTTNELWLDGQKQTTVQTPVDNYYGSPYDRYRAGIVSASGNAPFTLWTDEVGIGYVGPLAFNWCRGVNDTVP